MKVKEIIGRNIRRHRETLGVRQGALAQQLSITPSALSQIETGKTDISVDRIDQIAGALNLSFYELMTTPNHVGGIKSGIEVEEVTNNTIHLLIDKIDTLLQSSNKTDQ
ncbi:MAG: Helix-turn-helix domain [Bacteroidota bacterium]|jgi:transcriptional regulator with XRE-family HTH domain